MNNDSLIREFWHYGPARPDMDTPSPLPDLPNWDDAELVAAICAAVVIYDYGDGNLLWYCQVWTGPEWDWVQDALFGTPFTCLDRDDLTDEPVMEMRWDAAKVADADAKTEPQLAVCETPLSEIAARFQFGGMS